MNSTFEEFLKEFWGSVNSSGKCPHCNTKSTSIRKEGSSKFFISAKGDENFVKVVASNKKADGNEDNEESDSESESN